MDQSGSKAAATLSLAAFAVGAVALVRAAALRTAMSVNAARVAVGKLRPSTTTFLLCDVQERFRPLIHNGETVISTCRYMTSVAKALRIPVVATQQYTKVFGPTVPDCFASTEDLQATPIFEKKLFSMLTPEVQAKLDTYDTTESYVIMGIEAHVCVQQTCLDLLEQGKDVHLIVDAVSSQQLVDREVALQRLQAAGVYLTTAQTAKRRILTTGRWLSCIWSCWIGNS